MLMMKTRFGGNSGALPTGQLSADVLHGGAGGVRPTMGQTSADPLARHRTAPITFAPAEGDAAELARAPHMRRALESAADHGTALLTALGLPRLVDAGFAEVDAGDLGDALDVVISHLDALDPDPDLGPNLGAPENHTATIVRVCDWRWQSLPPDQRRWSQGACNGGEADVADEPHDEDADVEMTAIESHGTGFRQSGPDDAEDDDPGGSDESGIGDLDGYHEQCGYAVAGAPPWSVGGHIA